jgi:uncharacterized membrane protein
MWPFEKKVVKEEVKPKHNTTRVRPQIDQAEKYKNEIHNYVKKIAIQNIAKKHNATERYISNYLYHISSGNTGVAQYFDHYASKSINIKPTEKIQNIESQINEIEIEIEQLKRKAAKYAK